MTEEATERDEEREGGIQIRKDLFAVGAPHTSATTMKRLSYEHCREAPGILSQTYELNYSFIVHV